MRATLASSSRRVATSSMESALVETFRVGGDAIRVLATDPLLPDEIVSGDERRALSEATREYDQLGRQVWAGFTRSVVPR